MKINRLQHALLTVKDLEEARKFYKEVLDLEEMDRWLIDPARDGAWFRIGTTRLHLAAWQDHPSNDKLGQALDFWDNHIAFEVDDIEEWKRKLKEKRVEYVEGVMGGKKMDQVYLKDPSGNMVELIQHNVPI